ncbi:hypothetical protein OEZ85_009447 [Tetradesmus obliquus]|uniref:Nuclear pore protein n=1 Tax=Tetradesmus obliquus TaxID=3088 RepID=A0ABY8UE69_TETOB|nr:hypothetical protein OEZ85_009447 [Tetradesmus obliquus]
MEKAMLVRLGKHLGYGKAQARKLEEENRHLHARESILLAYCHLLSWMGQQECHEWSVLAGLDSEQQQQDGFLLASDTEQFSKDELQLLQQLQSSPLEGMVASVQQEPTVAPDDDLLFYFRRIFSLPPYPGAADMTMQDVSTHYNEVVRELSLNLALHDAAQRHATEAGGAGEWPLAGYKPWQNIRAAFDRLANNFVTLTQMQRDSMHMLAVLVNHADLSQPLLQEANLDDHIRCVRQMGLSAAQKQQIADGYAVFSQLLQPVLLGMRQLQLQQPGDSAAAAAAAAGYKMHREVLHQQEQRTAQLKQLMRKHVLTQLALCGYMMGRCTYTQFARLYMLLYPRQPSTAALGRAVVAILKEDQTQLSTGPGAGQ